VESLHAAQVSYLPARTYEEAGQEFRRMRKAGFDTVILRVFQNPGDRLYPFVTPRATAGVYFLTAEAKVVTTSCPNSSRARVPACGSCLMSTLSLPLETPGTCAAAATTNSRRGCCRRASRPFHAEGGC
jgi:hypothetical protein